MSTPELPDMGDPIPRDGPTRSEYLTHRNWLLVIGAVAPWAFLYVGTRNPGLLWLPVLNLLGSYAGMFVMVRSWRQNKNRRLYVALAAVLVCWIVCTEVFRRLN